MRTVTLASLLDDAQSLELVTKKIKQLKKEGLEVFLNGFSNDLKDKYRSVFEKVSKGELKAKDFLSESIKSGDDKIIQKILIVDDKIAS